MSYPRVMNLRMFILTVQIGILNCFEISVKVRRTGPVKSLSEFQRKNTIFLRSFMVRRRYAGAIGLKGLGWRRMR